MVLRTASHQDQQVTLVPQARNKIMYRVMSFAHCLVGGALEYGVEQNSRAGAEMYVGYHFLFL